MSGWQVWGGRLSRALSLRVLALCLVAGVGFGVLVGLVWPSATMPTVWVVAALCYVAAVLNDGQMVRCDPCRKRVKLGANRCHHCGFSRG